MLQDKYIYCGTLLRFIFIKKYRNQFHFIYLSQIKFKNEHHKAYRSRSKKIHHEFDYMALINSKLHLWYELDDTFYDFVKI
jgi:hypothetical protein